VIRSCDVTILHDHQTHQNYYIKGLANLMMRIKKKYIYSHSLWN